MAQPAVPGGLRVGIALSNGAGRWLTTDSYGRFRILSPSAGSIVRRAWQPLPRSLQPDGQIGAVWTPKRWRAMLEGCYANDAATDADLLGHVCSANSRTGRSSVPARPPELPGQVGCLRVQRFRPRFIWYSHTP